MNKLISAVILAAFTAVCSFGVSAESHNKDKGKETTTGTESSKKDGDKYYGKQPSSTSEIMREKVPDDVGQGVKDEYRDQEVMNKKPYKEKK
jgi:hypothetical protein